MKLRPILYALPLLFLAVFFLYPLAAILRLSFGGAVEGGQGLAALVADRYYLEVIWFSAWQAGLSTLLTLLLGLPAAYVFARYEFRGKTLLRAVATVPFVMPTVVVAAAFTALLGPRGMLNAALQSLLGLDAPPIRVERTLGIILLAHVFYNYTVVLRIVGGVWSTLDTRLEQAAAVLGADRARAFREVTLPLLLPAVGAAALLVFIFSFSSFGVVLLLGGPSFATVEVEIYRQTAQFLRLDVAAALSLIQILATLLMTLLYTRLQSRGAVPLELRARAANVRPARTPRERWLVGGNVAVIALLIGAPLLALALRSVTGADGTFTLAYYRLLDENRTGSAFVVPPLIAVRNSLLFALAAMGLALVVGVPAAYLLARRPTTGNRRPANDRRPTTNDQRRRDYYWSLVTRHSSRNRFLNSQFSILNSLLDPLFMLPLGTSAVTLGLGYVLAFGRPPLKLIGSPLLIP
ncbi:MAG TPA: iron ABC transporter permease, partial [Roseiflexaceae bacterium]|nr:iron ABC transporter permease [Roseiflexaceae bacterium]